MVYMRVMDKQEALYMMAQPWLAGVFSLSGVWAVIPRSGVCNAR